MGFFHQSFPTMLFYIMILCINACIYTFPDKVSTNITTLHQKEYNTPPYTHNGVNVDAKNITRFLRKRTGKKTEDSTSKIKKIFFFLPKSSEYGSPRAATVRR